MSVSCEHGVQFSPHSCGWELGYSQVLCPGRVQASPLPSGCIVEEGSEAGSWAPALASPAASWLICLLALVPHPWKLSLSSFIRNFAVIIFNRTIKCD